MAKNSTKRAPARKRARFEYHTFAAPLPPGVDVSECHVVTITCDHSRFGLQEGDDLTVFRTDDVRRGDLVWWRMTTDDADAKNYISRLYSMRGGRVRFEQSYLAKGYPRTFWHKAEDVVINGRVLRVEREGRVIDLFIRVRGISLPEDEWPEVIAA